MVIKNKGRTVGGNEGGKKGIVEWMKMNRHDGSKEAWNTSGKRFDLIQSVWRYACVSIRNGRRPCAIASNVLLEARRNHGASGKKLIAIAV